MKPNRLPPIFLMSSPAAYAEPPVNLKALLVKRSIVISAERTGCNNIIYHNHLLTRLDGVRLHLEEILTIFLVIGLSFTWARQFALLANRDKTGAQSQSETRADKETSGL